MADRVSEEMFRSDRKQGETVTGSVQAIDPDQLLTTNETARLMGIQPNTLAKWRTGKGGLGPRFVLIGRAIRYRRSDIQNFFDDRTVGNNAEARTLRIEKSGVQTYLSKM